MTQRRYLSKELSRKNRIANSKLPRVSDEFIREKIAPYHLELSQPQVDAIGRYLDILLLWNQKVNLTSLTDPGEILGRHFGESMFAAQVVPMGHGRLADVGSGAGFPGLALKLICNQLDITLMEPNQKKAAFLAEVVRALELGSVKILGKRILELELTDSFDLVTARAVGGVDSLLSWAYRSLGGAGHVVLWLGAKDVKLIFSLTSWLWREPVLIPQSRNRVLLVGQPKL